MTPVQHGGVDYSQIDPFKVSAQRAALTTDRNIERLGFRVVRESRGESVFIVRSKSPVELIGGVIETLGTKSLVADAMGTSERSFYDHLAQDTVAMIVNDAAAMGMLPVIVGQLLLIGDSAWFTNVGRCEDLISGWKNACNIARCVFGPGETAVLSGVIETGTASLSGFALSIPSPSQVNIRNRVAEGDSIILFESSGIHANGLTNARELSLRLPHGYNTKLSDGRPFGEALLAPTIIYSPIVEDALAAGIPVHYAVHITGHGWRKLMRSSGTLEYVLDVLPDIPEVLGFIVQELDMSPADAYATFNMGAGYAIFTPERWATNLIQLAKGLGIHAWKGGYVARGDTRRVVLTQLGITYEAESLNLR